MRLIHLTDPHLTVLDHRHRGLLTGKRWLSWLSWRTGRRERHLRSRLDALIAALETEAPDAWAVTGDLCQVGLEAEIEEARDWLIGLDRPERVLVVPGNHDIFAPDSSAPLLRRWAEFLHVDPERPEWPVVRRYGDIALIGVNSAVVTPVLRASGRLGTEMRGRLERVLAAHRGYCRVVLIHHPPLPGVCKRRKALADDTETAEILRRHAPAMVLHGHLHRNRAWNAGEDGETRVFCTASASAGGPLGSAAARVFDIERTNAGFEIRMRLLELDEAGRAGSSQSMRWESSG